MKLLITHLMAAALLSVTAANSVFAQSSEQLITEIAGVYKDPFTVDMADGSKANVVNELKITAVNRNQFQFSLELNFENAASCSVDGKASYSKDKQFIFKDTPEGGSPCQLIFTVTDTLIKLTDVNHLCRNNYCGAQGGFDGAQFKRTQQTE